MTQTSKRPQETIAIGSGSAREGHAAPASGAGSPQTPDHAAMSQPPSHPPAHPGQGYPGHAPPAAAAPYGADPYGQAPSHVAAGMAPPVTPPVAQATPLAGVHPPPMPPAPGRGSRDAELQMDGTRTVYEFTGAAAESGDPRLNRTFIGGAEIDLSNVDVGRSSNLRSGAITWIIAGLAAVLVIGAVVLLALRGGGGAKDATVAADDVTEAAKEEPAKEEPAKEEPAKEEPAKEEPAKEEPAKEEPAKEEPAKEEPAKEEPAKEEPAKEEPAKPAPKPSASKAKPKPKPKPSSKGTTLSPKKPPRDPFANLPQPP